MKALPSPEPHRARRSLFGRRDLATLDRQLDLLSGPMITGSPVITIVGPKGGGTKTSTASAVLRLLGIGDRIPGMLLGIDANPDVGDLPERLGVLGSRAPYRFADFALRPTGVQHPADWGQLVDVVGRVHLLHNQSVSSARIDALTIEQYRDALLWARRFAAMTVVDTGTSVVHPANAAAVEQASTLVIATRADPLAINKTAEAVAEIVQAGFGDLVGRATVALTKVDKNAREDQYGRGMDFLARRVQAVHVVPYDPAAGAVGPILWDKLRPATLTAWTQVLMSALTDLQEHYTPMATTRIPATPPVFTGWPEPTPPVAAQPVEAEPTPTPDPRYATGPALPEPELPPWARPAGR